MNTNTLIEYEINKLVIYINRFNSIANNLSDIEDKIKNTINNFYEVEEKLIILYNLKKNINDLYINHQINCEYKNNPSKCPKNITYIKGIYIIENTIKKFTKDYSLDIKRPELDIKLIGNNIINLEDFPEISAIYIRALEKLTLNIDERSIIDDLRLSLELLLKKILGNSKSIENQNSILGNYLKKKNTSKELNNMLLILINYYSNYQNSYIKHNDSVKKEEVDFIVNLTSSFINFFIKIYK
jgi:hypothetical protein